jgi:hypothetical protein
MQAPESEELPSRAPPWFATAATGLLSGVLFLVPGLLALLSPVPLLVGFRRHGQRHGMQAAAFGLCAAPLLAMFAGAEGSTAAAVLFGYLLVPASAGALLAWGTRVTADGAGALVLGVTGYLVFLAGLLGAIGLLTPGSMGDQAAGWVDQSLNAFTEAGRQRAAQDVELVEVLADLQARRDWYRRWGVMLLPSFTASVVALGFWLNLVYARWFVGGRDEKDDLSTWRLPQTAIYAFMVCTAGVVFQYGPVGELFPRSETLFGASVNGLVFLGALYWLQGVAVVNHWFLRLPIGPGFRLLGVAAQALTMMFPPTSVLYGATGLADAWFDLRRLDGEEVD